ncbi:MAG: hypothetical protein GYB67_07515 [Chloroflexi bacterium]|nr:hypothetical protein [Chloroflexota bacterium]
MTETLKTDVNLHTIDQQPDDQPRPTCRARVIQAMLIFMGLMLFVAGIRYEIWVLAAFAILAFVMSRLFVRKSGPPIPEDSRQLRQIAFAAQIVAALSLAYVAQVWVVLLITAIILMVGHGAAYRYRAKRPRWLQGIAFVALHAAFFWMIIGMVNNQPYPQAQVAMLGMAAVSAVQFTRMNLISGMSMGLLNLYVAASLSRDLSFLVFLGSYLALMLLFLWQADTEDGLRDNPVVLRPIRAGAAGGTSTLVRRLRSWVLRFGIALPVAASLIFVFTPRFAGHPIIPPVTFNAPVRSGPNAQIINPALPLVQVQGWTDSVGDYYYGFDTRLDLAYRGGLSDTIMMYVRSPAWSYWRSHAYDTYDGRTWTQASNEVEIIERFGQSIELNDGNWFQDDYFVQTFQIVQPMPNLVFTGGQPMELYMAVDSVAVDSTDGIRVGQSLDPGMIYSVASLRQAFDPDALRAASTDYPDEVGPEYLQIPEIVTDRTRQLAHDLTRGLTNNYDRVIAIRDHLLVTYPYDFFPPPQAPNTDAIDQFLFVDQRGVCEHYVSAMVIMLRELGIPARLVAGFGSGTFNQFTNFYEVRANDAHAWVEVYFPEFGWVPFDPTPGWEGDPQTGPVSRWVFSGALGGLNLALPLGDILSAGAAVFGGIGGLIGFILVIGAVVALIYALWRWRHRLPTFQRRSTYHTDASRRRIFAAYRRAQRQLRSRRADGQTVQEHAEIAPTLQSLADLEDIAAYRPEPPDVNHVDQARSWRPDNPADRDQPAPFR